MQSIKKILVFGMFVSSHTFPLLWESIFPMFLEFHGFLIHAIYVRNPYLSNVSIFTYFSRTIGIHFPHVLGTLLLMRKLVINIYFQSYFHLYVYVSLFTKEFNLFCCWARSITCISDRFVTEVWRCCIYNSTEEWVAVLSFTAVLQFLQYSYEYGSCNWFQTDPSRFQRK